MSLSLFYYTLLIISITLRIYLGFFPFSSYSEYKVHEGSDSGLLHSLLGSETWQLGHSLIVGLYSSRTIPLNKEILS